MEYVSDIFSTGHVFSSSIVPALLAVLLLPAACVILIRHGRRIAERILRNEPEESREDRATIQLNRRDLIMVLLIGMGVFLIYAAPALSAFIDKKAGVRTDGGS